jgi:hypothetical protein
MAALLVAPLGLAVMAAPGAARSGQFQGSAAGAGVRVTMFLPNAPATNTPVDGGGPVAQAALDSLQTSQAFASNPYPGDVAIAGPGLVAGFVPGFPSLPGYPLYAASSYPQTPEAQVSAGPAYDLAAKSSPTSSSASALAGSSGGDQPGGRALARADISAGDAGAIVAMASGEVDAFTAGPLRIGRIASSARTTLDDAGRLTRESSLEITGMNVGGTEIAVGPAGITIAGNKVPLPGGNPVEEALARAGIKITYVNSEDTEHGVVSAGLRVTQAFTFPTAGSGTITYVFGQSSAALAASAGLPVEAPVAELGPLAPDGGASATTEPAQTPVAPPAPALPSGPSDVSPPGSVARAAPLESPPGPGTSVRRSSPRGTVALETTGAPRSLGTSGFYLMLVVAAAVALGAAHLVRILGVRLPWNS